MLSLSIFRTAANLCLIFHLICDLFARCSRVLMRLIYVNPIAYFSDFLSFSQKIWHLFLLTWEGLSSAATHCSTREWSLRSGRLRTWLSSRCWGPSSADWSSEMMCILKGEESLIFFWGLSSCVKGYFFSRQRDPSCWWGRDCTFFPFKLLILRKVKRDHKNDSFATLSKCSS